jgi:peptidoglycan/LPS O-acetylase OafA/YrhL
MVNHGIAGFQLVGQTGVTLFFVLSGFLITTILLEERQRTGRLDLRRFYVRRIRRLLPALIAMLLIVTPLAWLAGHADAWSSALLALFYSADFAAAGGAPLGTILHTWSLAVEEQFYLIWPLVLLLIAARPRVLLAIACASIVVAAIGTVALDKAGASYLRLLYGPDTRSIGLLLGVALASVRFLGISWPNWKWLTVAGWLGVGGFVVSCIATGPLIPLLVVMPFAALFVVGGSLNGQRWLTWQPLTALGAISYGVYLWDLPLRHLTGTYASSDPVAILGIGVATIAIAALSARTIERAFRAPSTRARGKLMRDLHPSTLEFEQPRLSTD